MMSLKVRKKIEEARRLAQLKRAKDEKNGNNNFDEDNNLRGKRGNQYVRRVTTYQEQKQIVIPLYIDHLKEKLEMEAQDLLFFLCLRTSGFKELLDSEQLDVKSMSVILDAATKACTCKSMLHIVTMLRVINSSSSFLERHVPVFLSDLNDYLTDDAVRLLGDLGTLLCNMQNVMPDPTSEIAQKASTFVTQICDRLLECNVDIPSHLENAIDYLQKKRKKAKRKHIFVEENNYRNYCAYVHPDEFRAISIVPTVEDLTIDNGDVILRPNIVEGRYESVTDYLDVHFRLVREDLVRPLRNGITSYITSPPDPSADPKKRDVVNVYTDVHIKESQWTVNGMVHVVNFDATPFKDFSWEDSKRLVLGNLVCISCDNFKTVLFATVVPNEEGLFYLQYGIIRVHFISVEDQLMQYDSYKCYVMVESAALFEAFRHNLHVLQIIDEDHLPFKDYLVDVQTDVKHISYVPEGVKYDLTPLWNRLSEPLDPDRLSKVELFDDGSWPSGKQLGYDEPQIKAIKGALREEFCLIQGPPGTGKTYIVLKIIETILKNRNRLTGNKFLPIMVVSHTNHALDQVLEGVVKFTERVVRIGNRSKSTILEPYMLNKHVEAFYQYGGPEAQKCRAKMTSLREELNAALNFLTCVRNEVIHYEELKKVIAPKHQRSLESSPQVIAMKGDDSFNLLSYWLQHSDDDDDSDAQSQSTSNKELFPDLYKQIQAMELKPKDVSRRKINVINEKTMTEDIRIVDDDEFKPVDDKLSQRNPSKSAKRMSFNPDRYKVKSSKDIESSDVYKRIYATKPMSEKEAKAVNNVFKLGIHDKWSLYCYWWRKFIKSNHDRLLEMYVLYEKYVEKYKELKADHDASALRNIQVIGMTTTGAAKYRTLTELLKPYVVIVEEAAQVIEAHVITSLRKSTKHLILVGDHQQLQPHVSVNALKEQYKLSVSLFERMITNGFPHYRLETQYRMRPSISALLVPEFYPSLVNAKKVLHYEEVKGVRKSMYFIDHTEPETPYKDDELTYCNKYEANFIVALCRYLIHQGYKPSQISILTLYNGQLLTIKEKLQDEKYKDEFKDISIANVDGYQGRENDIMLISMVRSNEEGKVGFLTNKNRMCVCISRARIGMYCIGNFDLITSKSELWYNIINKAKKNEAFGKGLEIFCEIHSTKTIQVVNPKHFEKIAPLGGCNQTCGFCYPCKHVCKRKCHPGDRDHQELKCEVKCNKLLPCPEKHRCQNPCHSGTDCEPCKVPQEKILPHCGHKMVVECSSDLVEVKCKHSCNKILSCQHRCSRECHEICSEFPCTFTVGREVPCGHGSVSIPCGKSSNMDLLKACPRACTQILECGHECQGTCGTCLQGRLHYQCTLKCERTLVCGHMCLSDCGIGCPPCLRPCEIHCPHRFCSRPCGDICSPCKMPCEWNCPHFKCTNTCDLPCNRPPCFEPCPLELDCGHPCMGLCGENCPPFCSICDRTNRSVIFTKVEEVSTRYYELEDCGHFFPIDELNRHMEGTGECIRMKTCPKCHKPIWNSKRFSRVIFECLKNTYRITARLSKQKRDIKSTQYAMSISVDIRTSDSHEVCKLTSKIKQSLTDDKHSMVSLLTLENHLKYAKRLAFIENKMLNVKRQMGKINTAIEFALSYSGVLVEFITQHVDSASFYQLREADREIRRLEILSIVIDWYMENHLDLKAEAELEYSKAVLVLVRLSPFLDDDENAIRMFMKAANQLQNGKEMDLPNLVKSKISRAVCAVAGDWFKCPQSHIYCSPVQYGGDKEEFLRWNCNECIAAS